MSNLQSFDFSKTLDAVLSELQLTEAYQWFEKANPSNHLPYHNIYHTRFMMRAVEEAGAFAGLSHQTRKELVLAALFHDFDHSGGALVDAKNIENALNGLRRWANSISLDPGSLGRVERLIRVTEFPYVMEVDQEAEFIIRDADMLQLIDNEYGPKLVFEGLPAEMKIPESAFLEKSPDFYGSVRLLSKWGSKHEKLLRSIIARKISDRRAEKN